MPGKSLVTIVRRDGRLLLLERSFDDIAKEEWGQIGKRPMVYLTDPHEAIAKAMWCYLHDTVPLIGEKDPAVARYEAAQYKIDSLITDATSAQKLFPLLESLKEQLCAITLFGDADAADIASLQRFAPVRHIPV